MIVGYNQVLSFKGMTGGVRRERVMLPLVIRKLSERGVQSVVFVASDCNYQDAVDWLEGSGVHKIVKTRIPSHSTWKRVLFSKCLFSRYVKEHDVDLFVDLYYPLSTAKTKTCFLVHDLRFVTQPETYSRFRHLFLKITVPYSLKRADHIVAVSGFTKEDIIANRWAETSKISVVYNSFDSAGFISPSRQLPQFIDLFLNGRDYFLCVGHLEPRKNLKRIIMAYSRYRSATGSNVALIIVGKANEAFTDLIQDMLTGTNYAADVLITGFVEDQYLPSLYESARIFLFPSLHEGFGIPVLEAMAAGTPVIASETSALPEVCGGAAHLVDPESIHSIEQGINLVMANKEYADKLVEHGYLNLKRFDSHALAGEMVTVLDSLLGGK